MNEPPVLLEVPRRTKSEERKARWKALWAHLHQVVDAAYEQAQRERASRAKHAGKTAELPTGVG